VGFKRKREKDETSFSNKGAGDSLRFPPLLKEKRRKRYQEKGHTSSPNDLDTSPSKKPTPEE